MSIQITLSFDYVADQEVIGVAEDCRWLTAGLLAVRIPEDFPTGRLSTQVALIERIPPLWMRRAVSIRYAGELREDGARWGLLILELDNTSSRLAAAEAVCEYLLSRRHLASEFFSRRAFELLETWLALRSKP